MVKHAMDTAQLIDVLRQFDLAVSLEIDGEPLPSMVIVGGAAFVVGNLTTRRITKDIDVVEPTPVLYPILAEFPEVNADSMVYLDCLPYNYEDRLTELNLGLSSVKLYRPCLEDLVVMKLRASRGNDIQDINSPNVIERIDWELLERLVYDPNEAKASCMADLDYKMLVLRYEDYVAQHRPKDG